MDAAFLSFPFRFLHRSMRKVSRRREYERNGIGVNWKFRGVGYLHSKLQVVLAAKVVPAETAQREAESRPRGRPPPPTHSVRIYNVYSAPPPGNNGRIPEQSPRVGMDDDGPSWQQGGSDDRRGRRRRPRDDCHKLTVWVRAHGPEIFAGSAEAVPATDSADCHWKFDVAVRTSTRGAAHRGHRLKLNSVAFAATPHRI
jgi:hypothetical protein